MQKEAEQNESTEAAEEPKPVEKKEEKKKPAPKKEEKKDKKQSDKKKETKKSKDKKEKKDEKKDKKKTETKKKEEQEEIPMDAAAIKAYSSVIADAAEDSEPQVPVQYHETITEEPKQNKDVFNGDPMASMIQNEISDIKDASIKAAKDRDD